MKKLIYSTLFIVGAYLILTMKEPEIKYKYPSVGDTINIDALTMTVVDVDTLHNIIYLNDYNTEIDLEGFNKLRRK